MLGNEDRIEAIRLLFLGPEKVSEELEVWTSKELLPDLSTKYISEYTRVKDLCVSVPIERKNVVFPEFEKVFSHRLFRQSTSALCNVLAKAKDIPDVYLVRKVIDNDRIILVKDPRITAELETG